MKTLSLFVLGLVVSQWSAIAVDLDLAGKVFKKDGTIKVQSTAAVPAALLYDIRLEASGTGTGTFGEVFASGDLATRLDAISSGASHKLRITLANLSQKLPVTLGQTMAFDQLSGVPIAPGTQGSFISKGKIKAQITKDGIVKASASKMSFKAQDFNGTKLPVTGEYTINTGKLVVEPTPATSTTPRPDFILLLNSRFTIGNDEYVTNAPGTVDVPTLKKGKSKSLYFIVQNDGPAADDFTLRGLIPANGLSLRVFDGKTEITDAVFGTNGFAINALPSGGTKLFRMVVKVGSDAQGFGLTAGVRVLRTAAPSVSDTGGFSVIVR